MDLRNSLAKLFDLDPSKIPIRANPGEPPELPYGMGNISLSHCKDAILKGVINSLTGVINSLFNPAKDILIICGGDSQFLTKSLKTQKENIIHAPDLVMEGMIIHHLSEKT